MREIRTMCQAVLVVLFSAGLSACDDDGADSDTGPLSDAGDAAEAGDVVEPGFASTSLAGLTVVFSAGEAIEIWEFDPDGETATLRMLGGSITASYTYGVTATDSSRLVVELDDGDDQYDMTWTSSTTGTYAETFDGTPLGSGTFEAQETE